MEDNVENSKTSSIDIKNALLWDKAKVSKLALKNTKEESIHKYLASISFPHEGHDGQKGANQCKQ